MNEESEQRQAPADSDDRPDAAFQMGGVAKHTVIYGIGIVLSKAISFILLPIYTRYLTTTDYGVLQLVEMTLDVFAIVGGANLALGVFRFYHKADTERERNAVVTTALILLSVSYVLTGGVAWFVAEPLSQLVFSSPEHAGIIRLAAANLMLQSLLTVPLAYVRLKDLSIFFVSINAARMVIGLSLNILTLVYWGMGVRGLFIANLITTAVLGVGLGIWLISRTGLRFSSAGLGDLVRYGMPLMAMHLALFVMTFGDRYFLQAYGTTAEVGIYALAYQFGFLLGLVGIWPFEQVWGPKRFAIAKRADRDPILSEGFLFASVLLITVGVGISLFVGDVVRVMTTPAFYPAAVLVHPILVAYTFNGWCGIHDIGILVREKTVYMTVANWAAAGVAVLGYALLVPRFGGMGAAVATVVSLAVRWALTYTFSQRLWHVEYDWRPVRRLCAIALGVAGVGIALPAWTVPASLGARSALLLLYSAVVWAAVLDSTHRDRILAGVRYLSKKLRVGQREPRPGSG